MVKVNKGLLAGQTLGNEFSKLFPTPGKVISGVVTAKKASRKINIDEGLLRNQSFWTNDIKEIRINEGEFCYGGFNYTFNYNLS